MNAVQRLSRITLICSDPDRLADFYQAAFGFERAGETSITEPAFAALIGIPGARARVITLQIGGQDVEFTGIHPPGRNYPHAVSGRSPLFQHFAIVVSDMAAAYGRLSAHGGFAAISTDGPQLLPASSGGVTAYKFRNSDGHPLELIAFARDAVPARWQTPSTAECLGIDHSAISVAGTQRSVNFYERLGLPRTGGSLNRGPEQDRLDGVAEAVVEVTALAPPRSATPHIELLCYRDHAGREPAFHEINDIAATQLVLDVGNDEMLASLCAQNPDAVVSAPVRFANGIQRALMRDPDGHLLCLEAPR